MSAAKKFVEAISYFFMVLAVILMIAACCTVPSSEDIYFLKTTVSGNLARNLAEILPPSVLLQNRLEVKMGILGFCINEQCTNFNLGYRVPAYLVGGPIGLDFLDRESTRTLAINPVFTAFSGLCLFLLPLVSFFGHSGFGLLILILNTILGIVTLIIDLAVFVRAFNTIRDSLPGTYRFVNVYYGSSFWLVIVAVSLTIISTFIFAVTLRTSDTKVNIRRKNQDHA